MMLIHELLNKDLYIVPEESPPIIFDIKSAVCMAKNGRDTKHTRQIYRRIHFVINSEKCKQHNIDCCEGGMKLADIATDNVGDNYLNPRMKYITVMLDN